MCVWQSPWKSMPRKSSAKVSLPEPMSRSCICTMWWMAGFGLSGPAFVLIGIAIEIERPLRTSEAARRTCSGVM